MSALSLPGAALRRIAVLDTETAGFPRNNQDNSGRLLEIGAFCVDMPSQTLVGRQLHALHLPDNWEAARQMPDVRKALKLSDTDLEGDIAKYGQPGPAVQRLWEAWAVEHEIDAVAAFNLNFDRKILPWVTLPWLRCLMKWSGDIIQERLPPGTCVNKLGKKKARKLAEAREHLGTLGATFPEVEHAHRAPFDAYLTAFVLVGLAKLDPSGLRLDA